MLEKKYFSKTICSRLHYIALKIFQVESTKIGSKILLPDPLLGADPLLGDDELEPGADARKNKF